MVTKKTDPKKPSPKSSLRSPKKKAAQSKTKCAHRHAPKDKTIDIVNELKIKNTELERFASFPRLNPNPVLEVDSSGKITFMNNAAKDILRKLNLEGDGDVFLPEDIHIILRGLHHKKEKEFYREVTIQGRVFGERLHLTPEFHAVRIYAHDITDRKKIREEIRRAEISLKKERDFITAVLSTAGALVIVLDVKGRIVIFNKICEQVTGYIFDEVKGKPFWDILLISEERKSVKTVFKELKAGKFPNKHENYWVGKDGTRYLISWSNTALLDDKGGVEFIVGTGIDITAQKQAEEKLKITYQEVASEKNRLKAVMEALPVGVALVDNMGGNIQANLAFEELWGEPRPAAHCVADYKQYKAWWANTGKPLKPEDWASARAIQHGETVIGQIVEIEQFSGNRISVFNSATPIRNAEDKIVGSAVAIMDITALRRAEDALRESEAKFRSAFANTTIGFAMRMPNGFFVDANQAYRDITGYGVDELKTLEFSRLIHPDDFPENMMMIDRMLAGTISDFVIENRYIRKGGSTVWVRKSVSLVRNAEKTPQWIIELIEDITKRKQIEESLRKSQEDLSRAQAVAHTGSWRMNIRKNELLWSDENHRIFGIPKGIPMTYETFLSTAQPDDREYVDRKWRAALQGGPYDIEHRIVVKGHVKWVRERAELEFDKDGSLLGGFGTTQDITERKRAEEALIESEERLNMALYAGHVFAFEWNPLTDEVTRSRSCEEILGLMGEVAIQETSKAFFRRIHPQDRDMFIAKLNSLNSEQDRYSVKYRLYQPGGAIVVLEETARAIFDDKGQMVKLYGMTADVTEREKNEQELREANNRLRILFEGLEREVQERTERIRQQAQILDSLFKCTITPLVLLDKDFNFIRVNQKYADVCSRDADEFAGHNHFEFYPHEENEAIFRKVVKTKKPYLAIARPFVFPDHPEWGVTYWDWTLTPLMDEGGEVNFLVFALNDVTGRKKTEDDLKESREKLRNLYAHLQLAVEAERTKISREIHDEFGTILTALNIDLSWLQKKLPGDQHTLIERIKKDVELINSAIKVVQRISSELRPGVLDYLGFSSAVEWQVKEFGNRTGIDWDLSIDMKMSDLNKDISIALFRILQESLTNIARYAEASKIKVYLLETDSILTLDVVDNGKGITEEQLSDPHSLGILGMRERIQYLSGDIDIKGIPNKGTTVTIRVPIAKQGYER